MPVELEIHVTSPVLYNDVYRIHHAPSSSDNLPAAFILNDKLIFRLFDDIHNEIENNEQKSKTPDIKVFYLDDNYWVIKRFSDLSMNTIWFNPGGKIVDDAFPHHDAELCHLSEIPDCEKLLNKPSLNQCLAWWDAWELPENVRAHSTVVSRAAYILAVKLRNQGIDVDPILTHRGGLLHDLDKMETLRSSDTHGKMCADFLLEAGYPEIAQIVREHIMSKILQMPAQDWGWEVKLVYFCDKLVEGDTIVSFDERLAALKKRYPHYIDTMDKAEPCIWALSDKLCDLLSIPDHSQLILFLKEMQYW